MAASSFISVCNMTLAATRIPDHATYRRLPELRLNHGLSCIAMTPFARSGLIRCRRRRFAKYADISSLTSRPHRATRASVWAGPCQPFSATASALRRFGRASTPESMSRRKGGKGTFEWMVNRWSRSAVLPPPGGFAANSTQARHLRRPGHFL